MGLDASAEHYYCSTEVVPDDSETTTEIYNGSSSDKDEEQHPLSASEACFLNDKDDTHRWRAGRMSNRFSSIEEIHEHLKTKYIDHNIVSYREGKAFKEMLYIIDGIDMGFKAFGEVWVETPNGIWKDLLPESFVIKCAGCGKIHKLEDVSKESMSGHGTDLRAHIKFHRMSQIKPACCGFMDLVWNAII